jgi:predicted peroxiredoxin
LDARDAKILIIMNSGPGTPKRCPAPFLFAQEAAAMGADVSIYFVAEGPMLLKQGVPEKLYARDGGRSIGQFIEETLKVGVKFYVCAAALELNDMTPDDLVEAGENLVGPSFLIGQGLEADLVLTF